MCVPFPSCWEKNFPTEAFLKKRTYEADRFVPTYKNGLEFHQQQKFLLATWLVGWLVEILREELVGRFGLAGREVW